MKSKYIFKSNPPAIKDAEIKQMMDFEGLMNQMTVGSGPSAPSTAIKVVNGAKIYIYTALVAALTSVATYYIVQENNSKPEIIESTESQKFKTISSQPKIVDSEISEPTQQKTKPTTVVNVNPESKKANQEHPKVEAITPVIVETQEVEKTTIAKAKYLEASPDMGYDSLYSYFSKALKYPTEHLEEGLEGVVMVQCTIDKNGKVKNTEITQSLGGLFDQEALRVIQSMPAWSPASINGKNTSSKITIPLTFRVLKSEKK